jgi:hypothetical protein
MEVIMNKLILSTLVLFSGPLMAMEQSQSTDEIMVVIDPETAILVNESDFKDPSYYQKFKEFLAKHKKTAMATGSAALALGSNMVFGASNAPAATIFLGTFGTSIKGILPKSTDKQALKIGLAALIGTAAVGTDIGLNYAGFNTNWAFSNLALVGGMAVLKRVQKGHIKGDAKAKEKEAKKAEKKKEKVDIVLED